MYSLECDRCGAICMTVEDAAEHLQKEHDDDGGLTFRIIND